MTDQVGDEMKSKIFPHYPLPLDPMAKGSGGFIILGDEGPSGRTPG